MPSARPSFRTLSPHRKATQLKQAIIDNRPNTRDALLRDDASPNELSKGLLGFNMSGRAPVHVAAGHGIDVSHMQALIKYGADINLPMGSEPHENQAIGRRTDSVGDTPLHQAIRHGNAPVCEVLLEQRNIDLTKTNKAGETPVQLLHKREKLVAYAPNLRPEVTALCDAMIRHRLVLAPVHKAAGRGVKPECIRSLIAQGADINQQVSLREGAPEFSWGQEWLGDTPLHQAIRHGNEPVVEVLLNTPNIDLAVANDQGQTALQLHSALLKAIPAQQAERLILRSRIGALFLQRISADREAQHELQALGLLSDEEGSVDTRPPPPPYGEIGSIRPM